MGSSKRWDDWLDGRSSVESKSDTSDCVGASLDGPLISMQGEDGSDIFRLMRDGTIVCEPENYGLALREICDIFVRAAI